MNDQIKQTLIEDIDNNVAGLTNIQIMQIADIINSQPPADQWIPCSSGTMPSFLQPCFITVEYVSGLATTFRAVYWGTHWATAVENIRLEAVTAWMPAEPYKGE